MINIVDVIIEWYCYTKYIIGLFTTLFFTFVLFTAYIEDAREQAIGDTYAQVKYKAWNTCTYEHFDKLFNLGVLRKDDVAITYMDIDIATLIVARDYYSNKYYISDEKFMPRYKDNTAKQLVMKARLWDYFGDAEPTSGYGSRRIFNEINRSFYSRHMQDESFYAHPIYYDSYCPIYYNLYAILIRERLRTLSFEDRDFFERLKTRALPH